MIPTRLSLSLSRCRSWLFGHAPAQRPRHGRRHHSGSGFFRPQFQALEERCVLSTVHSPLVEAALPSKGNTAKPSAALTAAAFLSATAKATSNQVAGILAWDSQSTTTNGAIALSAIPGSPTTASALPPTVNQVGAPPVALSAPGRVVVPPAPVPIHAAPVVHATPLLEPSSSMTWSSLTNHPGLDSAHILTTPTMGIGSVQAQMTTPVAEFLPGARAGQEDPTPALGVLLLSLLEEKCLALELIALTGTTNQDDKSSTVLESQSWSPVPCLLMDRDSEKASEEKEKLAQAKPAPTRAELLAVTDKILQEYAAASEPARASVGAITLRAVVACAAAQTFWLTLRRLAVSRGDQTPLKSDESAAVSLRCTSARR
jgi:hypothetical protein